MSEPLKNIFSRKLLEPYSDVFQQIWPVFPKERFLQQVFDAHWEGLELKQRIRHISLAHRACLPKEYPNALELVTKTAEHYLAKHGENLSFEYIFMPDFMEAWGADHLEDSIKAMEVITRWSSAEFAVRPFLKKYPERMQAQMLLWSKHSSPMVRRLSSEGIRPRLPWGMGVPALKTDPSPILPILENLKNDPTETVRRSVANNLNDISKDHPDLVLAIAERWLGHTAETDWIVRHACRGLLKKGNEKALANFGFQKGVAGVEVSDVQLDRQVRLGGLLAFSFTLINNHPSSPRLRLEYGIDYQTVSGKISSKVFHIKSLVLESGQSVNIQRRQSFQDFTTRKHYVGPHRLRILVNGTELALADFDLTA